jgi:hypothetical protein
MLCACPEQTTRAEQLHYAFVRAAFTRTVEAGRACNAAASTASSGGTPTVDRQQPARFGIMERLVLSVWMALAVATLAGAANAADQPMATPRFPKLPVPAGDSLTEAKAELGRRLLYEKQVPPRHRPGCSRCQFGRGHQISSCRRRLRGNLRRVAARARAARRVGSGRRAAAQSHGDGFARLPGPGRKGPGCDRGQG